jgi:acetylornithine aminotransferase/acetylornithine/N-succinyldiaminopimelate aminotransferase
LIQCGIGRTGKLFCFEHYGVVPDIITLAKPIANGLPMGAVVLSEKVAQLIKPGDHGTTFGGSPLATRVGLHVWERISEPSFLSNVRKLGIYVKEKGELLKQDCKLVKDVRGIGLLMGLELDPKLPTAKFVEECYKEKLLVVGAGRNTIRVIPPLVVSKSQIHDAFSIFKSVLNRF